MKNKNILFLHFCLSLFLLLPNFIFAQGIEITSGGSIKITGAATIEISDGDIVNNGTYTKGIETITMSGTAAKTISGTTNTNINNLTIANTGGITTEINELSSGNITVASGSKFTIASGKAVTVTTALFNNAGNGGFIINSDATNNGSLIVSGTSSGNITYNRWITKDKWHIGSSPVETQDISDVLTDVSGTNSIALNGSDYGVTDYLEATNASGAYYTNGTAGNYTSGKGYLMRRQTTDGTVSFTGTVADADFGVTLSKTATTGYGWNALGNPFTSAMNANSTADAANNLITVNVNNSAIESSYAALYVWDEQGSYASERNDYKVINHVVVPGGESTLSGQNHIQVGQGFIVKAASNGATFSFTRAMQSHLTTTPFKSAEISEWADINVVVSNFESSTKTGLKFSEQMTNGLDIGYDAGILKGNPDFCLYTQLVEDNGVEFMLQCLPLQNLETMEIPVGLDATIGGEITLSIEKANFPASLIPVLNDKLLNTQFVFNTESDVYTTTANDNTKGFGRFTLTFSSITDVETILAQQAHFKAWHSNGFIYINGEINGNAQATVYDINGRKLAISQLLPGGQNKINAPESVAGIYLVKVKDQRHSEVLKVLVFGR